MNQRMYGSAEFQVTAHPDGQVFKGALFPLNRQEVSQGLGRVIMSAVPGIDDRHRRTHGCNHRCALFGVAHGDAVSLTKDYKTLKATDAKGNVTALDMPETSNVLQYFTEDGTKISVRPSGTEPKIKFYIEVKGEMGCPKCYASANAEAEKKVEAVRKSLGI